MFHSFTLNTSVIQTDGQTDRRYIYIYIYIYILATVKTNSTAFSVLNLQPAGDVCCGAARSDEYIHDSD